MKTKQLLTIFFILFLFSAAAQRDSIRDVSNIYFASMPSYGVVNFHPLENGEYIAYTNWWNGEPSMRSRSGFGLGYFKDSSQLGHHLNVDFHAPGLGGSPALLSYAWHYHQGCYIQVDNFGARLIIYRPVDQRIDTAHLNGFRFIS